MYLTRAEASLPHVSQIDAQLSHSLFGNGGGPAREAQPSKLGIFVTALWALVHGKTSHVMIRLVWDAPNTRGCAGRGFDVYRY